MGLNNIWTYVDADDRPLQESFEYQDTDGLLGIIHWDEDQKQWLILYHKDIRPEPIPFLARKGRIRKTYRFSLSPASA